MSVSALDFSPDGSLLASAGRDSCVHIWDAITGNLLKTLRGHTGWIQSVAFSPDGRQVLSGSECNDGLICVWDMSTGDLCIDPFAGPTAHLSTLFKTDGSCMLPTHLPQTNRIQSHGDKVISPVWKRPECILHLLANGWVVDLVSGKRIWWMPASHRDKHQTSHLMRLAIGHWSGRVTVVKGDRLFSLLRLRM